MGQSSAVVMSVTIDWDDLAKSIIISLVFDVFMFIWLSVDHLTISSTDVYVWLLAILSITSIRVTSSMNLNAGSVVCKSLIGIRKMYGPSHVPWGIPPFSVAQLEAIMLIFTRWRRSSKNECIHRMMNGCMPSAAILFNTILVINVIKRFSEVNECRSCYLLIVSCLVADVQDIYEFVGPFTAPNWWSSNLQEISASSHR